MAFKNIGSAFIDIDEIVAIQPVYGGSVDLTMRGGGVVKVTGNAQVDAKSLVEGLVQLLSERRGKVAG